MDMKRITLLDSGITDPIWNILDVTIHVYYWVFFNGDWANIYCVFLRNCNKILQQMCDL